MKKLIIGLVVVSLISAVTACGRVTEDSDNEAFSPSVTTGADTTAEVSADVSETSSSSDTASETTAVTETSADSVSGNTPDNAGELPVISSAEIVAVYNDYGDGYMYRLNAEGSYSYWNAELTMLSAGEEITFSASSRKLTDAEPYVTGGSTITELSAVVTPYDENGKAGSPVKTVWDRNRVVHETSFISGSENDTANSYGFYPCNEKMLSNAGAVSVGDLEGRWIHGQFVLNVYDCDRTSGKFEDDNEGGVYSGVVRLEYSIQGNTVQLWYNLYTDDGSIFKSFKVTGDIPLNEILDERQNGIVHERIQAE